MGPPKKSFCWCFTYQTIPFSKFGEFIISKLTQTFVRHGVASLEKCPKTGKHHYQGVLRFTKCVTFTAATVFMTKMEMAGCHIEIVRGTYKQAADYCMKEHTHVYGPWHVGDSNVINCDKDEPLDGDEEEEDIPKKKTVSRREFTVVKDKYKYTYEWPRMTYVVFGPPKTFCKSTIWKIILSYAVGDDIYLVPGKAKNSSARWLGDYAGERGVIIEEANYDTDFDHNQWKMITDRLPQKLGASMGGRSVLWDPEIVILITNDPIGRTHPFRIGDFTHRIGPACCIFWRSLNVETALPLWKYKDNSNMGNYDPDEVDDYEAPDLAAARRRAYAKEKRKHISILTEEGEVVRPYEPKPKRFHAVVEDIEASVSAVASSSSRSVEDAIAEAMLQFDDA